MEQKYLIDTNSLIDAQAMKLPEKGLAFLADAINENFTVSFITYIEFLGYKYATQANKDFIELTTLIEIWLCLVFRLSTSDIRSSDRNKFTILPMFNINIKSRLF